MDQSSQSKRSDGETKEDFMKHDWGRQLKTRLWELWNKYGSVLFLIAFLVNIGLLVALAILRPSDSGYTSAVRSRYILDTLAATAGLIAAHLATLKRRTQFILTIAIELFIAARIVELIGILFVT